MDPLIGHPRTSTRGYKKHSWKIGRSLSRYFSKTDWWLEIGSSLLSVLCLLGIIILLSQIRNRPLSTWNLAVSPNAFISVLSTASKACLVQPVSECISQMKWLHLLQSKKADRYATPAHVTTPGSRTGPWGSIQFIRKKPTKSLMPYLGCMLLLAAVTMDPFTQQIISFETKLVPVDGAHSELKTSQIFDRGQSLEDINRTKDRSIYERGLDTPVQRAVMLALYNIPQHPDLSCPGSLCRYPPFSSMGVTCNCKDVTSSTRPNCTTYSNDTSSEVDGCNFYTPGGYLIQGSTPINPWRKPQDTQAWVSGESPDDSEVLDTLCGFAVAQLRPGPGDWRDSMHIYECAFKLCAVEYTDWIVIHGTIRPGTTTTYQLLPPNTTQTEIDWQRGNLLWAYRVLNPTFPYNKTFIINGGDYGNIARILQGMYGVPDQEVRNFGSTTAVLYDSLDIPATMTNISAAISYSMLNGPNATVTPVDVLDEVVIIEVRWAWLTLPATLVLAASIFLVAIIYRTHRAEHLIWKSSLTPLLLSQESYPVLSAGQKPLWTRSYLKARTAVIVNHLTK
ncbi:hypothetical protein PG985_005381 [Apiospora marii]|uniref:Uncharacterized protein n=1 Tax=Apiospora marii TaxID=335849 RepID=A0ABR1SE44_9PEZI